MGLTNYIVSMIFSQPRQDENSITDGALALQENERNFLITR